MTRLKLRIEALATEAHQTEAAMRMLVGALGDDCPNPGSIEMGELKWSSVGAGAKVTVRIVLIRTYAVEWALSPRHAWNDQDYKDPVAAAKKIRALLKKAGISE